MNSITPLIQDKSFEYLMTALPLPVCVINEIGNYVFQNNAFDYLRQKSSHFIIGDNCKLTKRGSNYELFSRVKAVLAGSQQETLYLSNADPDETLWMTLTPTTVSGEVMVTVMMPDLMSLDSAALENRLQELFRLTSMEARCALLLAQGLCAQDIAQARDVSVPTVRTQLKAIREKLGVNTSLAVVAKVSKLGLPLGGPISLSNAGRA